MVSGSTPSTLGGFCKARGYSSVARAVALQAIGLGFKSPYLQLDEQDAAGKRREARGELRG
jgi:hypothetical protein